MKVVYDLLRQRRHPSSSYHQMDGQTQQQQTQQSNASQMCSTTAAAVGGGSGGTTSSVVNSQSAGSCGSRHIISIDSIQINKELGVGEFGVVQQGVWSNEEGKRIQVAIKCLSSQRFDTSRIEFVKEATIMHAISHEHIVRLYGVVLEPSLMLVTELAPLRSLLECLKEPALVSQFPIISLCSFAAQIADGMAYLESRRLIHRDLAARNILVFAKNKVKISDFGLSRALGVGKDYYQTNFNVNLKLPIAWCAPESINYLKFTSQSDVWAYGVTLWEMFSYGFQPWAALTGQQILEAIDEPSYQRLEQPECCPKEYYSLMLKCWAHDPNVRPKFSEIVTILPDCKPEMVQCVKTCPSNEATIQSMSGLSLKSNKEFLSYKTGDIITVLDKRGSTLSTNSGLTLNSNSGLDSSANLWKGALNDGKTGYFNPSDCVTYLGQNLPTSSSQSLTACSSGIGGQTSSTAQTITSQVLQSKFIRGFLDSKNSSQSSNSSSGGGQNNGGPSSPYGSRRSRLRPDMISRPQGDLIHTGHVGADGAFFGDVAFLDGKYHQLPKQIVAPYRAQDDHNHNSYGHDSGGHQRNKWSVSERKVIQKNGCHSGDSNHEYHEISDEEELAPLESPPFEILDFGPSLVEEVFRELDSIKPDLDNEITDSEVAINEMSVNVKNEVREINLKINRESAQTSKKKQAMVKPISASDQIELDSAIAMAKDIATRSMLTLDNEIIDNNKVFGDSPKTPNSPNKKTNKFSFKFSTSKSSPKTERRNFSEETESIGDIIESITPAAKEAYISLVDRRSAQTAREDNSQSVDNTGADGVDDTCDGNPLRMLRSAGIGGVLRAKVRGNRSFSQPRLPTTAQTAGLARVASTRSTLGVPPPVPTNGSANGDDSVNNALPLPPRDRSRPMLMQLKTHQRRHPLVIPTSNGETVVTYSDSQRDYTQREHSPHRTVPVLKHVSCPQPPQTFLDNYSALKSSNYDSFDGNCDTNPRKSAPIPPPKPQRSYLGEESFESEMQKALDSIQMDSCSSLMAETTCAAAPVAPVVVDTTPSVSSLTNGSTFNRNGFETKNYFKPQSMGAANEPSVPSKPPPISTTISGSTDGTAIGSKNSNNSFLYPSRQQLDIRPNSLPNVEPTVNCPTGASISTTYESKSGRNRSIDCDEVRVMQKVLAKEIDLTAEECARILASTEWDVHKAIKCIRLRQQLRSHAIDVECDWAQMLAKFNWNIRQASNYLIATQGVPEDTTEV